VVHVVVVMVVMMMMVMMHLMHRSGRRRSSFLCDGIAGEAERQHGGGGEGLDHGKIFLWLRGTSLAHRDLYGALHELGMNRPAPVARFVTCVSDLRAFMYDRTRDSAEEQGDRAWR
jgi:hypothetical protein